MSKNHMLAMMNEQRHKLLHSLNHGFALSIAIVVALLMSMNPAHADLVGGLNSMTSTTNNATKAFYGLVGAGVVAWLLWEGLGLLQGRTDWKEFAVSCGKVAVVGGILILAPWLWNYFVNGGA